MNKSFLKFITDFGPLLIFFTIYYKSGNNLSVAITPLIIANGQPDVAIVPSHLASLGFYLLRARTQLREIIDILEK